MSMHHDDARDTANDRDNGNANDVNIELWDIDEDAVFSFRKRKPMTTSSKNPFLRKVPSVPSTVATESPKPAKEGSNSTLDTTRHDPWHDTQALVPDITTGSDIVEPAITITKTTTMETLHVTDQGTTDATHLQPRHPTERPTAQPSLEGSTAVKTEWDLVWKGSWIVPTLVPATSAPTLTSGSKRTTISSTLKKLSLDNNQPKIFEGKDGVKVRPNVSEYSGIVFALPKSNTPMATNGQAQSRGSAGSAEMSMKDLGQETNGQTNLGLDNATRQLMKEDTEMHFVAKIDLSTFPMYLVAPGFSEPCRVFVNPKARESAYYLRNLFTESEIVSTDMKKQYDLDRQNPVIGPTALLLRVAKKPGTVKKKTGLSSHLRQSDNNPFLISSEGSTPPSQFKSGDASQETAQWKRYQDVTTFIVYGVLDPVEDDDHGGAQRLPQQHPSKASQRIKPTVSFFARPLVDHMQFSANILAEARSWNRSVQSSSLQGDGELLDQEGLSQPWSKSPEGYTKYDDLIVDSIMNGEDDDPIEYESQATISTGFDEDIEIQDEMEILDALERSRTWSPFTVSRDMPFSDGSGSLMATSTKGKAVAMADMPRERPSLTRAQTMGRMSFPPKESLLSSSTNASSSISATTNTWSRHRSADGHERELLGSSISAATGERSATGQSTTVSSSTRRGLGRLKSPSKARRQPMDVTTNSLRMKLLGPGSIRKGGSSSRHGTSSTAATAATAVVAEIATRHSPSPTRASVPIGLLSPTGRKSMGYRRSTPEAEEFIPDLTTMLDMKRTKKISVSSLFTQNNDHGSQSHGVSDGRRSPSFRELPPLVIPSASFIEDDGALNSARSTGSFFETLKSLQNERDVGSCQGYDGSRESDVDVDTKRRISRALSSGQSTSRASTTVPSLPSSELAGIGSSSQSQGPPTTSATPSGAKSIEQRNKSTVKALTTSVLTKIQIGPNHEDFRECASNLYRSVKFSMRKDITTRLYHLEELERLMDRHAALL
ncbi:hypothetical protein BGW38_000754 [Lunasporangiospora selenospora]|uniref:Sld7 C-terminal domain-containing protein n=1 Tax=Lunasporangiospora selenospora TaxID=979761 RepID=A0A9P6KER6_9FUNG|nr:hypothetical protein BGW38_000754 [Lunasporangiospora selenospora]